MLPSELGIFSSKFVLLQTESGKEKLPISRVNEDDSLVNFTFNMETSQKYCRRKKNKDLKGKPLRQKCLIRS